MYMLLLDELQQKPCTRGMEIYQMVYSLYVIGCNCFNGPNVPPNPA